MSYNELPYANKATRRLNPTLYPQKIDTELRDLERTVKKRSKYGNVITVHDGIKYASILESKRAVFLDYAHKELSKVLWWARQAQFVLLGRKYVVDFIVMWSSGMVTVEDVKGAETDKFKDKIAQLKVRFPNLEVVILKKGQTERTY